MKSRMRILVVDDEPDILQLLTDFLSEGYEVCTASSVAEAKKLLKEQNFSLLITDVAMPECSGEELIQFAAKLSPRIPTLVLSGLLEIESRSVGATAWINKPFRRTDLVSKVDELLSLKRALS